MNADNLASTDSKQLESFAGGALSDQGPERYDLVKEPSKILIYKRTHRGDPDDSGIFGVNHCMGSVRKRDFDAVIGVGGKRPWHRDKDIARKVNWVGIWPYEVGQAPRGRRLKFEWFCRFDEAGSDLKKLAPRLFGYMFKDGHGVRVALSQNLLDKKMQDEVQGILTWAEENKQLRKPHPIVKGNRSTRCGC